MKAPRKWWVVISSVVIVSLVSAILVGSALAAGIDIQRNPAPPQAVINDGTGVENTSFTVTFATTPDYVLWRIRNAGGVYARCIFYDISGFYTEDWETAILSPDNCYGISDRTYVSLAGATSPISQSPSWTVPNGINQGVYYINVAFYNQDYGYENSAETSFYVANALGTLVVRKYGDSNSNGVWDTGEDGLSGWVLKWINPLGVSESRISPANGIRVFNNVPAGDYNNFSENPKANWVQSTPSAGYGATLPPGGTLTVTFGNVNTDMRCDSLAPVSLSGPYHNGSQITYHLSYSKLFNDLAVAPTVSLYFTGVNYHLVSDTSGKFSSGSGTGADPYDWTLDDIGSPTSTSFDVTIQFDADPANSTFTGYASVRGIIEPASPSDNNCSPNIVSFGPTAVALISLSARPDVGNSTRLLLIVSPLIILSAGGYYLLTRRRKG
jgi:hypothetical protein